MGELSHPILLVSLVPPEERSRSTSPNSSSSTRELKGIRLFRAIGKKLSRRRHNDDYDSTDSEPSSSSESPEGGSESGSGNNSPDNLSPKETNASALRRVLTTLNLATSSDRRCSDSNSDISSSSSKKKSSSSSTTPKKILRQPVSYTYVRGLSGLPTIRVPRTNACCAQSCCRCHTPGCGR